MDPTPIKQVTVQQQQQSTRTTTYAHTPTTDSKMLKHSVRSIINYEHVYKTESEKIP